ncbi:MAG TPA: hypothetical protein PLX68_08035 [Dermatophilaceae bacterium]|jgi:hypothetical protein|nr:hypothetical protein [Dermatophilaceae bacterium]
MTVDRAHALNGIHARLEDAELLWTSGRRESGLLICLVAFAALSRLTTPRLSDREAFEVLMKTTHSWTIRVEYRGSLHDIDHILYKWLRCELIHTAALPVDLAIDDTLAPADVLAIRAGGPPQHRLLISPAWFTHVHAFTHQAIQPPHQVQ